MSVYLIIAVNTIPRNQLHTMRLSIDLDHAPREDEVEYELARRAQRTLLSLLVSSGASSINADV